MFPNVTAKKDFEIPNGNTIMCYRKITHCEPKMHSLWVQWLWIPPAKWIQLLLHLFTGSSNLAQDCKVLVTPTQHNLEGKWLRQLVWSSFHTDRIFTWKYFWKVNCDTNSNCRYYYWKLMARKDVPHKDHCWIQALYINETHLLAMYIMQIIMPDWNPLKNVTELIPQTFFINTLEGTARPGEERKEKRRGKQKHTRQRQICVYVWNKERSYPYNELW